MLNSMCMQVDLFSGHSLQEPIEAISENEFLEMAQRQGIAEEVINYNPCPKCRYFGLCDPDDCAMHGFRLDSKVSLNRQRYE